MSDKPTQDDIRKAIVTKVERLLADIRTGRLTGAYSVEFFARDGGIQPDSIHTNERSRVSLRD